MKIRRLARPESCTHPLTIVFGLISFRSCELRKRKGRFSAWKQRYLTSEEREYGLGRKEQKFTVFLPISFSFPLPLQTASGYGFCSCSGWGCCRIGAFKNSLGCELLGEGREFPCSPKVPGDTQGCLNTTASCRYFRETARNVCLGAAQACWKCSRMQWTEMCLSKILERSDCWRP